MDSKCVQGVADVTKVKHGLVCLQCLLLCLSRSFSSLAREAPYGEFPEQSEIDRILVSLKPEGMLFLVMEQDEDAFQWVLPRVIHYTRQLRDKWGDLTVVVLSHGDEMFALLKEYRALYEQAHKDVQTLTTTYDVLFQVCGSYAFYSDIDQSEFPGYVDVVPFAPAEIENYRMLDYEVINLELTW